jgi:TonB-dependent SusC/RagA subfamily outer membrane receptor
MRFLLLIMGLLLAGYTLHAQQTWSQVRKSGWQVFVYKISADTAEQYIRKGIPTPETYLHQTPFAVWQKDSMLYTGLPVGNYVVLSINNYHITANYYCQSRINVYPINNQHRVQLEILDSNGLTASQAAVWVNKKRLEQLKNSSTFLLKNKYPGETIIKVTIPGDTLFMELTAKEEVEKKAFQQRWYNFFNYNKTGRLLAWPVKKIDRLFDGRNYHNKRRKSKIQYSNNGYMVFNKPLYKPNDTVKLKAYILDKKQKQVNSSLAVYIEYSSMGKYISKELATVKPQTPGAFLHEFILGDSLKSDQTYYIVFYDKKKNQYAKNSFVIEDYLLDEVSNYDIKAVKTDYFRHDTLVFNASARDANGLALMDGKVSLFLLRNSVNAFYKDRMYIPDTLWKAEKNLAVEGDTRFEVPGNQFPEADINITVKAVFKNGNNETQEKQTDITLAANQRMIQVEQADGFITATYWENGKPKAMPGTVAHDKINARPVQFPYREKIQPHISYYSFQIKISDSVTIKEYQAVNTSYRPQFRHIQEKDLVGFGFHNPYGVAIHYTVFNGNKLLANGVDTASDFTWKRKLKKNTIYQVQWNYIWADEEQKGEDRIVVMNKLLQTEIEGAQTVYPGQKDTITVSVKDYKGNPAKDVNLAVVSYNTQFGAKANVKEPPYLQQFKIKRRILFDNYELEDADFSHQFLLGKHTAWVNNFHADSMLYYQLLFPENGKKVVQTKVAEFLPQVAIHAVEKGVPQPIHLLYINRDLAWYNGVTDKAKYAFAVMPGFVQFGFRLKDKFIEVDSIYLQPYYKHDIVIDIDHLTGKYKIEPMPETLTTGEKQLLESRMLRLENNYVHTGGYIWQGNTVVQLTSYKGYTVGPFKQNLPVKFYKPGSFDSEFSFEPAYRYRLSEKIYRLEKMPLFDPGQKVSLSTRGEINWTLGDTLVPPPEIKQLALPAITTNTYLETNDNFYTNGIGTGQLMITLPKDSSFEYGILRSMGDTIITRVKRYNLSGYFNVLPGKYQLVLKTYKGHYTVIENIEVSKNGLNYVNVKNAVFNKYNSLFDELVTQQQDYRRARQLLELKKYEEQKRKEARPGAVAMPAGNAGIAGQVKDRNGGAGIAGASVSMMGYLAATLTDENGGYRLTDLKAGKYTVIVNALGYESYEQEIVINDGGMVVVNASLKLALNALEEVVVVGYGIQKKQSLTGAVTTIKSEEITSYLSGKVAGLQINGDTNADTRIMIRGLSSLKNDNDALYVVDGVVVDKLPDGIVPENIAVLRDAIAVSLYGARAANGVIVITTKGFAGPVIREQFRDYAFWQPNLITNKKGQVSFIVTYPDNITSWQTFVVGMDKKKRITKTSTMVKAFKPLLAQLSAPQFLVEGDSSVFTGKLMNYTGEPATAAVTTTIGQHSTTRQVTMPGKESVLVPIAVQPVNNDTLSVTFSMDAANGFKDGELRKIPVVKKGIKETIGDFWVLTSDTTFTYMPVSNGAVTVHAQTNTLDVLLDELKQLKAYPYFCMEQTASKIRGLLAEQKIMTHLKQPFKEEKLLQQLKRKLQEAQNFDGGWSWWKGGQSNLYISTYITKALQPLKEEPLMASTIRNAVLYLQNQLNNINRYQLVEVLYTLSETGHQMDYVSYLRKIPFDSISMHSQWQVVKIKQMQQLPYSQELNQLINKKTPTMLGGIHWGIDSYSWQNNAMATTTLAFQVLNNEKNTGKELGSILQYFLESRKKGAWRNTVESANITSVLLPYLLAQNALLMEKPVLAVHTNTTDNSYRDFPLTLAIKETGNIDFKKSGGGMMYLTAWQTYFNTTPQAVTDKFSINSWFEKNTQAITHLQAGEKAKMKIEVTVHADAEYVQLEIPIPAGCTYIEKKQDNWRTHREYLKDKMIIFIENMPKGKYNYEIELEPRYNGKYQLNPVKAELMYFPTFYGRNEGTTIAIQQQ